VEHAIVVYTHERTLTGMRPISAVRRCDPPCAHEIPPGSTVWYRQFRRPVSTQFPGAVYTLRAMATAIGGQMFEI
jgi:hypothetical protein